MKKIFLVISLLLFSFFTQAFSYNQLEIKLYYDKVYSKLESSKTKNELLNTLKTLDSKLSLAITKTKNTQNLSILRQIYALNKSKILLLEPKEEISFITDLKKVYNYLEISNTFEFLKDWKYYRFDFSKYYQVNQKNYKTFINQKIPNWYLIKYNNQYLLVWEYKIEEKKSYKDLEKLFSNYLDESIPYSISNWAYYSYNYTNYLFFDDVEKWVYLSDLENSGINFKNTLFVKTKDTYYFVNNYQKIRIVWEDIVKNIKNKEQFLTAIIDDNRFFPANYDDILKSIQSDTSNIISWLNSNEEKIKAIYDFVINRTTYYENYSDGNKQVFSWVLTYKNKTWVCDWYTKLFLYMLSFAWIDNVEIKKWFAFDNTDFPNFWHAWVKIWNTYYDPTFDDPIWWTGKIEYYYFSIPYELMYVNRFDWIDIPTNLKNMSLQDRKTLVLENMYKIYEKYKNYELMNKIKNRIYLWLSYNETLNIEKLSKKIPYFVVWADFKFTDNSWNKKQITSLNYYLINDTNIETVVLNPKINLENMYFFKWYKNDWSFDYRLAYDVTLN